MIGKQSVQHQVSLHVTILDDINGIIGEIFHPSDKDSLSTCVDFLWAVYSTDQRLELKNLYLSNIEIIGTALWYVNSDNSKLTIHNQLSSPS